MATNDNTGVAISSGGHPGPTTEHFATEDGAIAGWNSGVDPAIAVIAVAYWASAVHKGLALDFDAKPERHCSSTRVRPKSCFEDVFYRNRALGEGHYCE